MPSDLHLQFCNYRILRAGEDPSDGVGRYDVQRPDGSYCCQGVLWRDVEATVLADIERAREQEPG
jgi:hypothetical protein